MTEEQKRERNRAYQRRWYLSNKKKQIERSIRQNKRVREYIWSIKVKGRCSRCPEDHPACLDFHHIDPTTKEFNISVNERCKGITGIKKEIEKCVLLCSNCHRKEHCTKQWPIV